MKTNIMKKLRSRAGETITETLVSVLIGALALVMLAGAVSTASRVITTSRDKLNKYYDTTETVIKKVYSDGSPTSGEVTIKAENTVTDQVEINYDVNTEFGSMTIVVYKMKEKSE